MDPESVQELNSSAAAGPDIPTDWDGTQQALSRDELRRRIEQYNAQKEVQAQ